MSKFNTLSVGKTSTINYMGGKSFIQPEKIELTHAILTSFIESSYYESKDKRVDKISDLVKSISKKYPEFIAKLAIYARKEFNMRSVSHVLIGELAKNHKGDNLVSKLIESAAIRPDDLLEIVAYLKKPIPNQVKKGVEKALHKFDEYQLAKYRHANKDFSMVDLFNLVHPKPVTEQEDITWNALVADTLINKDTWEAKLSKGESHVETWKELLKNKKLGYMACLRNLRNILKTDDIETIQMAADFISNEKAVKNSKQLPFRFLSAYKALIDRSEYNKIEKMKFEKDDDNNYKEILIDALNEAIKYSVSNIPLLKGKTLILSDNSGSMRGDHGGTSLLSACSNRTTADIANLFAVLYWSRAENTSIGLFGDKLIEPEMNRKKSLFENFSIINEIACTCGLGTEEGIFTAFERLCENKQKVDRIVIFSDCQVGKATWYDWSAGRKASDFNKLFQKYKTMFPKTIVYSIQLRGYGNTLFANNIIELAGWSDKIFNIMEISEKSDTDLIKQIEDIQI